MATLSTTTRRKLKYLSAGDQGNLNPRNPSKLACWNFALTGFDPNAINPSYIFMYAAGFANGDDLNALAAWYNTADTRRRLDALRQQWQPHQFKTAVTEQAERDFESVTEACVKLAIEANGLTWTNSTTPYELVMYYDSGLDGSGELRGPNWTHWWLRIDGGGTAGHNDGIEAFPDATVMFIRRPEYSSQHVVRLYLTELKPRQVDLIEDTLAQVIEKHRPAQGAWLPDNTSETCLICGDAFGVINRRHHCRSCGNLVCSSCSPSTRQVANPVVHPQGGDNANGALRVCMYCE